MPVKRKVENSKRRIYIIDKEKKGSEREGKIT